MADAVTDWNGVLLEVVQNVGGAPGPISRGGAMMHGAIYDAVNSIVASGHRPYLVSIPSAPGASVEAAVAHAAHDTLAAAFPSTTFDLARARQKALNGIDAAAAAAGEAVGRAAAQAMIAARMNDGSQNNAPYTPGSQPGDWRPTGSGNAASPNWPRVKPWAMPTGSSFRPPRPGGFATKPQMLASGEYAAQVEEVKRLGRFDSTQRTAEQTEIAFFWANDLDGTYKPPGQLCEITQIVSKLKRLSLVENARLFALVSIAMADAAIVAWDAKYETDLDLWRPESAIHLADTDGNPATTPDAAWQPLSIDPKTKKRFTPPFPAYVSGHATFSAAHAAIMRRFLNTDNVTFKATTQDPSLKGNVKRTFNSFTAAALENARSRVYLGVHYQWDADAGFHSGTALGEHVFDTVLTPVGA
jgi:hypothetical protein